MAPRRCDCVGHATRERVVEAVLRRMSEDHGGVHDCRDYRARLGDREGNIDHMPEAATRNRPRIDVRPVVRGRSAPREWPRGSSRTRWSRSLLTGFTVRTLGLSRLFGRRLVFVFDDVAVAFRLKKVDQTRDRVVEHQHDCHDQSSQNRGRRHDQVIENCVCLGRYPSALSRGTTSMSMMKIESVMQIVE